MDSGRQVYTFLFTDVEGSTRLWERYPAPMNRALQLHDAILRESIGARGGSVFKTMGDAFYAVFPDSASAMGAASEAQQALLARTAEGSFGPLRVRMAIHTGVAYAREDDYFGPSLNRLARLLAVGHGGQILVSEDAFESLSGPLPVGTELLELGPHRLRDFDEPEWIRQLNYPSMPESFPRLKTLDAMPNNLPREVSSFIGREVEVREVRRLVAANRLATLTGSGGCGKTRLAIEVAGELLGKFEDGIWLVEFAPLSDAPLVAPAIARTLQIGEDPTLPTLEVLRKACAERELLLILDNCEHLIQESAAIADALLKSCPRLKIIATSREALGLPGEATYIVPSLTVPLEPEGLDAAQLLTYSSAQLFVDRATSANPRFVLDDENVGAIAQLCRRLDGIPLALELAAARIRTLSASQIADRLDDRFRLLTGGSRTALPRQQTLRAALAWSYNLLTDAEKCLLRRVSVFRDGWTLEACEATCSEPPLSGPQILDLLTQLVDKSLVHVHGEGDYPRYALLENIRQFAREQLFETDEAPLLRRHHVHYYRDFAVEAAKHFGGAQQVEWLNRTEAEHSNIRAAFEWSQSEESLSLDALILATSLHRYWEIRGFLQEGRKTIESLLERVSEEQEVWRMRALNNVGTLMNDLTDHQAAEKAFSAALALARKRQGKLEMAVILNNLGLTAKNRGFLEESIAYFEESSELARDMSDQHNLAMALDNLGDALREKGDYQRARQLSQECLQLFRSLQDQKGVTISISRLAEIDLQEGHYQAAYDKIREALRLQQELEFVSGIATLLELLARILLRLGQAEQAALAQGRAGAMRQEIGLQVPRGDQADYERLEEDLAAELGTARAQSLRQQGRSADLNALIDDLLGAAH